MKTKNITPRNNMLPHADNLKHHLDNDEVVPLAVSSFHMMGGSEYYLIFRMYY
jgi:hypothetical protein